MIYLIQAISHFVLIPVKVIGIIIVASYHRFKIRMNWRKYDVSAGKPTGFKLKQSYVHLKELLYNHVYIGDSRSIKGSLYLARAHEQKPVSDHQCLRHGTAMWAHPTQDLIDGMVNYIIQGDFKRGFSRLNPPLFDDKPCPPAVPMSIAFGITSAMRQGLIISGLLKKSYLNGVDKLIENDFELADSSSKCRLISTGFDAIYILSLLHVADRLSGESKYRSYIGRILITHGALLIAPITYFKGRNYYIDHTAMFGLWTMYQSTDNEWLRSLYGRSMRFVFNQSKVFTNPYFTALMDECGLVSSEQRRLVLSVHKNSDPMKAIMIRHCDYLKTYPYDWTNCYGDEFCFDDLRGKPLPSQKVIGEHYLNAIVLARSLIRLLASEPQLKR
ncbi:hypothetical protein GOV11_04235 [Candidatus Woesearchaeota archaeon]|nr:hypothetical protein [Candidatus Woesearchaeota archaeon]